MTQPMKQSRIMKLLLSVAIFLGLLGSLEALCRVLGLGDKVEVADYIADWHKQWEADFYLFDPGKGVNRDGVRDRNHMLDNPQNLPRIVFLGDSVTFGYYMPRAASYPAILEQLLTERGKPAEVFNVALPGWSTRQQRIAYREIVRKYQPDHVVIGFCLNDVAEMQNNLSKPSPIITFAYERSNLVRAVLRVQHWEIHQVEELFVSPALPTVQQGWQQTLDALRSLAEEVRQDGAKFSLLVFPFRFQVEAGAPEPIPQRILEEFSGENDIPFLDVLPILRTLGPRGFADYDHLSQHGMQQVARAIRDSDLLGQSR